jgi:peptidyl-prolyl cis-trans isomerase C
MINTPFPAVTVNGETIPTAAIAAETQHHAAPKGKPGIAWLKAANALVIRTLILQYGRAKGLNVEPEALDGGRRETEEEALIRVALDQAVETEPPSEADVRAVWEEDPERFSAPPLWEASHILIACDHSDPKAVKKALVKAHALTTLVQKNPKRFTSIAAAESDCASKSNDGALGQLGPGDTVPEFEEALQALKPGAVSDKPVKTRYGFHILRLDAVAEGNALPFEIARPKIAEALEKTAWARAASAFVGKLREQATITGLDIVPGR